ncbi:MULTISPECIES: HAMP domain-containing sensor histidine kinase [unclassified Saccharopolyspora]|uniref:sensor histidine kinase n=1 Tax=unclassified Saccharopolyspora TaxID=2646250 RepID=UPI001CD6FCFE|nr:MULTISPECIES: HAMP domain-containing sensor histidine kinase [unclassified Saccharopolyspora]MCA1186979.1 HAMP domain-containing histidine kinase [Saccharopolyspora sp. 6T]MCA1192642.1 HAMP domain-containing histidine kinase [Saccharopolyspora sp. 6V]MCA1281794.1 HAMP domain-containing histidine kinase [Saccharopolyspora sp. 7B]
MRVAVKNALAIAGVAALAGVAFALWTHYRAVDLSEALSRQETGSRLRIAAESYYAHRDLPESASLDDASAPAPLVAAVRAGSFATYVDADAADPAVWAGTEVGGHVLTVHDPYAEQARLLAQLDQALVLGVVALLLVSGALAVFIGQRLARRIGAASATALRIADGELAARVGNTIAGAGRDEVTALGGAVDAMAAELRARLEAERRVTADIAHELRTPVTGLVTAAELLPPGRPSELVRDRVSRLRGLIEDVLEVARLETDGEQGAPERIGADLLAERAAAAAEKPVRLEVAEPAEVDTDPRRVQRILVNLLRNAHRHGRPPVVLSVCGATLTVADHGPGFPADLLADGPRRFRTGRAERGGGHGLGLTIAAGQARVIGAELRFGTAESGGARADLVLG